MSDYDSDDKNENYNEELEEIDSGDDINS